MKSEMGNDGLLFLIEMAKVSHLSPVKLISILTLNNEEQSEFILADCLEIGLLYNEVAMRKATAERDAETDPSSFVWGFK